jgi:hypothetical protein
MDEFEDIILDGKNYRINPRTYQSKDIIDFAPRASVPNGSVFMSDLSLYQPLVQTDWRHGFGFHWYSDSAGYLRTVGNVDTRQNGLVMLYTTSVFSESNNNQKDGLVAFNGSIYAWGAAGLRKFTTGGGWTSIYSTGPVNFALSAGDYLFFCPDGARIKKMSTAEVVTDAGVDVNSTDYKWLIIHNGYIYAGKDGTNRIHYDSNPDLSQLEGTTADPGIIYCGIGNVPTIGAIVYAGQLYVARQDGLWLVGEDKIARNVIDYTDTVSSSNFRSMAVINGLLVFSIRDRIVQWNGARVSDITPERITDVFPYVTYGRFDNFVTVDNFLYCTARTNETTYDEDMLVWDGVGWHKLTSLITDSTTDTVSMLEFDVVNNRLWWHLVAAADTTSYIQLQDQSSMPYANFPTTGTHSLITSRVDMGFRQVKKSMQSLNMEVRNVTSLRYIRVYYSLDGNDWVFWADVTQNGITELKLPGGFNTIEFDYVILRFDFITNIADQSPILESYTLRFIMRPDVRWGYSFDIIASTGTESEGMADERTAAEIKEELRQIRDSKAPVSFRGLAGEEVYGYLTSLKEQPVYRTLASDGTGSVYLEFSLSCNFVQMI